MTQTKASTEAASWRTASRYQRKVDNCLRRSFRRQRQAAAAAITRAKTLNVAHAVKTAEATAARTGRALARYLSATSTSE